MEQQELQLQLQAQQRHQQRRSSASLPCTTVSKELAARLEVEAEGLVQHHLRAYEAHLYYQNREELKDPKLWTKIQSSKKGGFSVYRRVRQRRSKQATATRAAVAAEAMAVTTEMPAMPTAIPRAASTISQSQQQQQQPNTQHHHKHKHHNNSALPTQLLGVGFTIGTIEDMIFGSLATSTAAIKIQSLYIQDPVVDAAVLATLIAPNAASDPLRSVTLKWIMKKPKVYGVTRYRDYVFVESIGIRRSVCGERIGYHLMHSIDLPTSSFPPLDDDQEEVVRRRLSCCYLYRSIGSGLIECFLRSSTDPWRKTPQRLVVYAAANRLLTCCPGFMRVAETNKLIFALQQNLLLQAAKAREEPRSRLEDPSACNICLKSFGVCKRGYPCQLCEQAAFWRSGCASADPASSRRKARTRFTSPRVASAELFTGFDLLNGIAKNVPTNWEANEETLEDE